VIEGSTIDLHTNITKTRISFVACNGEYVAFVKHHLQFTMLPRNHIFPRVLKETHYITRLRIGIKEDLGRNMRQN